jgi:hypothetical protein
MAEENSDLRSKVIQFWKLWPVIKAKEGVCIQGGLDERLKFVHEYEKRDSSIYFRPDCATKHFERGEDIPMDFPHTLQAIYQVRCNLFHGSKSVHNLLDIKMVACAFKVLIRVLALLSLAVNTRPLILDQRLNASQRR